MEPIQKIVKKSAKDYSKDLFMMSVGFKNLRYFSEYTKLIGVNILIVQLEEH